MTENERKKSLHALERSTRDILGQLTILKNHPAIDRTSSLRCINQCREMIKTHVALLLADYSTPRIVAAYNIAWQALDFYLDYACVAAPEPGLTDLAIRNTHLFMTVYFDFQ